VRPRVPLCRSGSGLVGVDTIDLAACHAKWPECTGTTRADPTVGCARGPGADGVGMAEELLQWAMRIRGHIPVLVDASRVEAVTGAVDRLIEDGRSFAAGFERFLQAEPEINDWLVRQLDDSPDVYRS